MKTNVLGHECWTEDKEHKDGERAMTKLRCRARLQRGIVYIQLTQSIRMPGEYIVQANVLDLMAVETLTTIR
jgi:hypothetical protein